MAWLAFVAIAADLDFIGVWFFGVGPGSTWNHRGASHSMIMSLASGIVSMFVARRVGVAPLQGGAIGTLVGATHPLLDGFNLESAGSLLWWPFSQAYWQARCRFLPGVLNTSDYLTAHGVRMLALELIGSAPFFWIAFRRGKERGRERGTGNGEL